MVANLLQNERGDLKQHILNGTLTLSKKVDIVVEIAKTMQKVHNNNVLHADLKPSNLFITKEGVPKIGDWDHSFTKKDIRTNIGDMGLVWYRPPEVIGEVATMIREVSTQLHKALGRRNGTPDCEKKRQLEIQRQDKKGYQDLMTYSAKLNNVNGQLDSIVLEDKRWARERPSILLASLEYIDNAQQKEKKGSVEDSQRLRSLFQEKTEVLKKVSSFVDTYPILTADIEIEDANQQLYLLPWLRSEMKYLRQREEVSRATEASDIYALGMTYMELFYYNPPKEFRSLLKMIYECKILVHNVLKWRAHIPKRCKAPEF